MKISSIRKIGVEPVYNMTVLKHHNFMVGGNVILQNCDGVRYYCVSRVLPAEAIQEKEPVFWDDEEDDAPEDYAGYMTGGEVTAGYLGAG